MKRDYTVELLRVGLCPEELFNSLPVIDDLLAQIYDRIEGAHPFPNYSPPVDLHVVSDRDVGTNILTTGQIEAHYRVYEEILTTLHKQYSQSVETYISILASRAYEHLPKAERKAAAMQDRDTQRLLRTANNIESALTYARAMHGKWTSLYKSLSRAIEMRRMTSVPTTGAGRGAAVAPARAPYNPHNSQHNPRGEKK